MICKWCGEPLKTGARICRRCKQEIPALSDCGGFYDLVPESIPVPPPIPETPLAAPPPVHPVLPERKRRSPLLGVACAAAMVLALVFLILTISLSGKLADARDEADRLRDQLKSREETSVTDPTTPTINGFDQKDPEPTDEPEEILITLQDGKGEITLSAAQNARLKTETLAFSVVPDGEEDAVLSFTLQYQNDEKELFLQIAESRSISIRSVQWHSSSLVEIPTDEEEGHGFGQFFTSSDAITECTKPIEELGEGKNTCTLTGEDANGEELTITIYGIVIE